MTSRDVNGALLVNRTYGPFSISRKVEEDIEVWKIKDPTRKSVGWIKVQTLDGERHCVWHSKLDEAVHGLGLGKRFYQLLIDHYGHLESDPSGNTSDQAKRVWISLKAQRIKGNRFRINSIVNPNGTGKLYPLYALIEETSKWTGMNFIWNMMSWLKRVRLIPKKSL